MSQRSFDTSVLDEFFWNSTGLTSLLGTLRVDLAQQYRADLIRPDVHRTDARGFEVLERLHADVRTVEIPVVVLSSYATTRQQRRFRDAGVDDFFSKPLDLQQLLNVIDQRLGAGAASDVTSNAPERPGVLKVRDVILRA